MVQAVAMTTETRLDGNASSNTASGWSDPDYARKSSSRRRVIAVGLSMPQIHGHSNKLFTFTFTFTNMTCDGT